MSVFTIPVNTALLPIDFEAPPTIITELCPDKTRRFAEYSKIEYFVYLRKVPCIRNTLLEPWILANPTSNWSVVFSADEIIYGTKYWVNYEPDGLLEYLRQRTSNYNLIYYRDGAPIFTLQVSQIEELGVWNVRITTVWHNTTILEPTKELERTLQDMPLIFNYHEQCAVCLDNAFLVQWPTCTHSFCSDCTLSWRNGRVALSTPCPLCRAPS